jgi:hypothetical protein
LAKKIYGTSSELLLTLKQPLMNKLIQNQFIKFHEAIRLDDDDLGPVRDKRDMLIEEIKQYFKDKDKGDDKFNISIDTFGLGSYSFGTGIKPMYEDEDYDLDQALLFNVVRNHFTNALELKKYVKAAMDKYQRSVEIKKPCVRVQYFEAGMHRFHLDFACYTIESTFFSSKPEYYLARGTENSKPEEIAWEIAEPKELREKVSSFLKDNPEGRAQFIRIIRYMKRWKDKNFKYTEKGKPTGIAMTALALKGFVPVLKDLYENNEINDLAAIYNFVNFILTQFSFNKIKVELPVRPYNDLFKKMNDNQHIRLQDDLAKLKESLGNAINCVDPHEASIILNNEFGEDFEIISKEESAEKKDKTVFPKSSQYA